VEASLRRVPGVLDVTRDGHAGHEPTWALTTDPERDVYATTRTVIEALSAYRLVRIGQHRVALESIYRRAVEKVAVNDPTVIS
jgi:hypothetical protein